MSITSFDMCDGCNERPGFISVAASCPPRSPCRDRHFPVPAPWFDNTIMRFVRYSHGLTKLSARTTDGGVTSRPDLIRGGTYETGSLVRSEEHTSELQSPKDL